MVIEMINGILFHPIVLIACAILIVMLIISAIVKNKNSSTPAEENTDDEKMPYTLKESVLTKAEFDFARVLGQHAYKNGIILTKVSLHDVFEVDRTSVGKEYIKYFNKISSKHVDFLICDRVSFKPLYGIELDDSSHNTQKTIKRDAFVNKLYSHTKLKLIHIKCKREYTPQDFQEIIEFNNILAQSQNNDG